jgi:hypothetical protein
MQLLEAFGTLKGTHNPWRPTRMQCR